MNITSCTKCGSTNVQHDSYSKVVLRSTGFYLTEFEIDECRDCGITVRRKINDALIDDDEKDELADSEESDNQVNGSRWW